MKKKNPKEDDNKRIKKEHNPFISLCGDFFCNYFVIFSLGYIFELREVHLLLLKIIYF